MANGDNITCRITAQNARIIGFVKRLLGSTIYLTAVVGIFTLLPLFPNVTFTKYSVEPEKSLTESLTLNNKLFGVSKHFENEIKGPEGLLGHNNILYISIHDRVVKIVNDQIVPVVKFGKLCDGLHEEYICGRPMGLSMDKNESLYVADAYYGIFKVDLNSINQYEQIVSMDEMIDGVQPNLPNSVVIATDGVMYWTDSDTNYGFHNGLYSMFVDGTGRLLKYDPETKKNTVLIKNLSFANGVELSDDESFIIVAETWKYRIHKYYLKGPHRGKSEVFIDGLPGMPDNIKKIGNGSFYIPLVQMRLLGIDYIGEYPTIRMMIVKFLGALDYTFQTIDSFFPNVYCKKAAHWIGNFESPAFINSIMKSRLSILKVDENGIIKTSWQSTDGEIFGISDIAVVNDKLFLGSPYNNFLGVLNITRGF